MLMNKTLIAAAVSAALMSPVAAQADVTVYGRIHNGIAINDTDGAAFRFHNGPQRRWRPVRL